MKTIPRFVWLVVGVHVVFLLVGSLVRPLFDFSDEKHHADMVAVVAEGEGWPAVAERRVGAATAMGTRILGVRPMLDTNAVPRRTANSMAEPVCVRRTPPVCEYRPSSAEIEDEYRRPISTINRASQHPPLYYVVTHVTSAAALAIIPIPGGVPFDLQILSYRWVSILLIAPLPVLVYLLGAMLAPAEAARRAASMVPLLIPGLEMRNGPMVNNDNLLILLTTLLTIVLVRMIIYGPTTMRWTAVGTLTGLALLTKGLALVLPGVVLVAYAIRWWNHRNEFRRLVAEVFGIGAISFVAGGWWWLQNLLRYGQIQPSGRVNAVLAPSTFQALFTGWLSRAVPQALKSFWGEQMWPSDHAMTVFGVVTVALLALVIIGISASTHRSAMMMALSPVVLLTITVAIKSWDVYTIEGIVRGARGRYLYSMIAAIAVAVGIGLWRLLETRRMGFLAVPIIAVGAVSMQLLSLQSLLSEHWGDPVTLDPIGSYGALVAWSAIPPIATNMIMGLFIVGSGVLIAVALKEAAAAKRQSLMPSAMAAET